VSPEAMAVLARYDWPGNVRELENLVYRSAVIAQGDAILVKDLPAEVLASAGGAPSTASMPQVVAQAVTAASSAVVAAAEAAPVAASAQVAGISAVVASAAPASVAEALDFLHTELSKETEPLLERLEREMIVRALKAFDGNLARTSERLGMTRATLRKRVEELGLQQG
jgi:two-component system nitrogen regulation response regulator GlnG